LDKQGRTVLHLAVKTGNLAFIKYLIEVRKLDLNQRDNKGRDAISTIICGDRILSAPVKILEYLIESGASTNTLYYEKGYGARDY
jgi:ankyrin repeat protein